MTILDVTCDPFGEIPFAGARSGTTGQGSERKAAQPEKKGRQANHTLGGANADSGTGSGVFFFSGGGCGRSIARSTPLRTACSAPMMSAANKWDTAVFMAQGAKQIFHGGGVAQPDDICDAIRGNYDDTRMMAEFITELGTSMSPGGYSGGLLTSGGSGM